MSQTPQTAVVIAVISACALLVTYAGHRRSKPRIALFHDWYTRDGYAYFHLRIVNQGGAAARMSEGVKLHARHRQFSSLRRKYPNGVIADLEVIEGGEEREIEAFGGIRWVARTRDHGDLEALKRISRFRLIVEQSNGDHSCSEWLYRPGRWFWVLVNSTQRAYRPDPWDVRSACK
ncbi:hypothetical protein [Streptomyces chartreusis]|uniref:hypothetical protein n=1 Tax=Streptomyces chartreusis TaxID=1969 RepID=UPI00382375F6